MSRSGYNEDCDDFGSANLYRANVERSVAGKRGQAFLKELLVALDAMPVKKLIEAELVTKSGEVCALGAVAQARKVDLSKVDPDDTPYVAQKLGISECMAREIVYENDEGAPYWKTMTDWERYDHMRRWVVARLKLENRP